ncbi:MAG: hypothetical protein K2X27_03880 [Candidatus Obscuribacterales bacterium]|nr:hypothetical protein [Candidatus Obscuribacterales bacterium]
MFDKLDSRSVKAILAAQQEARRHGHRYVDVEQLLLGLSADENGLPRRALLALGLKRDDLRRKIHEQLGEGDDYVGMEAPFTDRMNALMELAWANCKKDKAEQIAPEHLLVACALVENGVLSEIFSQAGINSAGLAAAIENEKNRE